MITETPLRPRRSWPVPLQLALVVLIAAFVVVLGALVYVLLRPSDETANGLSISPDDPLAVAEYRRNGDSPLVGDHWHASYAIYIGDERQLNARTWEGVGIHTHSDGIIHLHPFAGSETGSGAALNKWFEYGGGVLTDTELRVPGDTRTYLKGNAVAGDGQPGEIYVIQSSDAYACVSRALTGQWVRVPTSYIPHDGDCIRVMLQSEQGMRELINNPPSVPTPIERPQP